VSGTHHFASREKFISGYIEISTVDVGVHITWKNKT